MGISWDFMGFSWDFIGGMSPTMCVFVSLQGIQQQGLPHPMGRSYRGYTPSSHAPSITLSTIYTSYLYIIYTYIYITYITYISTIYIYYIIYIYIPSYKSPFLLVSGLSISVPNIFSAFRVFACASAQRAVKAACIGSENASAKCFPRPPCSVQQIV